MHILVFVLLLLGFAVPSNAQIVAGTQIAIGSPPSPPSGSSASIEGLATSGGAYVLFGEDSDGGKISARTLVKSDLPSTVGYTDEAETWSLLQTFSSGAALADGTAGTPALRWTSDTNTGLFRPGNDILGFSTGGTERARLSSAGLSMAVPITTGSGSLRLGSASGAVNPVLATNTLGELQVPWLSLDVLELRARRFIADETIAYVGGSGMWSRGTTLTRDISDSATTIYIKHNTLRYLDFVVLRDLSTTGVPQYEVMRITSPSGVPQAEGDYAVSVDRNQDGTGANAWVAGQALVSTDRLVNVFSYSPTRLSYWGSVLGDRPTLAFNFMTSPAVDLAGTGATATIGSGASHATTAAGGDSVPGWFFRNGSAGALYSGIDPGTALNGVRGTCAISVELIVRIPNGGFSGSNAYIVQKGAPGSSANHFAVLHRDTGSFVLLGAPDGTWQALTPDTAVYSTAQYVHLVFTWSSNEGGKTYANGVQVGSTLAPPGGCLQPNASTIQGAGQWVTGQTTGAGISELAIYDYLLSPAQIRAHHEARNVGHTSLNNGPTITGEERTSTTDWHGIATRWALGQLQGIADYDVPTMGFWAGDEAATWISADAANGFRIGHGSAIKLHAKANGDLDLAGNLSLLDGGDLRSVGNWSLTRTGGLMFEPSGSSINVARAIRWSSESSITQVVIDGAPRLQLVGSTSPGLQTMLRLGNGMAEFTAPFGVVPASDGLLPLGSPTQRWANVNLAIEANASPAFVVVNKGGAGADANSALGYVVGHPTGGGSDTFFVLRDLSGDMCSLTFRAGLLMSTTC